jgi:hypothetical protein
MRHKTFEMREKQLRRLMILTVIGIVIAGSSFVEAWIYFNTPFLVIFSVVAILSITSIIMIIRKKRSYNKRISWVHDDLRNEQNEKLIRMYEQGVTETEVDDFLIKTSQLLDYVQSKKLK